MTLRISKIFAFVVLSSINAQYALGLTPQELPAAICQVRAKLLTNRVTVVSSESGLAPILNVPDLHQPITVIHGFYHIHAPQVAGDQSRVDPEIRRLLESLSRIESTLIISTVRTPEEAIPTATSGSRSVLGLANFEGQLDQARNPSQMPNFLLFNKLNSGENVFILSNDPGFNLPAEVSHLQEKLRDEFGECGAQS